MTQQEDASNASRVMSSDAIQAIFTLKDLLEQKQVTVPIMGSDVVEIMLTLSDRYNTDEIVRARERLLETIPISYREDLHERKPQKPIIREKTSASITSVARGDSFSQASEPRGPTHKVIEQSELHPPRENDAVIKAQKWPIRPWLTAAVLIVPVYLLIWNVMTW